MVDTSILHLSASLGVPTTSFSGFRVSHVFVDSGSRHASGSVGPARRDDDDNGDRCHSKKPTPKASDEDA